MKQNIYTALRKRIRIATPEHVESYLTSPYPYGFPIPEGYTLYFFDNEGLNVGREDDYENYIDSILHPMRTTSMWNVCQRIWSYICNIQDVEKRLLGL